jgi:DNA ligase-1
MRCLFIFVFFILFSLPSSALDKPELMLANVYGKKPYSTMNIKNYWVSEKYDGVRAYWDGEHLISRQGTQYHAPAWFTADFPKAPLDGELWLARGQFDRLSGIVRKKQPLDDEWRLVRYMVFDMPHSSGPFNQRLNAMQLLTDVPTWLIIIPQWRVSDEAELLIQLETHVANKAEGLMLHHGDSLYSAKRSDDLLKLKPSFDSEGIVVGYEEGKGKYLGMMGALWVEADIISEEGVVVKQRFKIGSGFTDKERESPPKIGSEITFKYSGLTSKGKPRFVRYWRIRLR